MIWRAGRLRCGADAGMTIASMLTLLHRGACLVVAGLTLAAAPHVQGEDNLQRVRINVIVMDADGSGVRGIPIVADRQHIKRNSAKSCGWTNADGHVTLDVLVELPTATATDSPATRTVRVPVRIAPVAPGCGVGDSIEETGYAEDWTQRLDALMKRHAFPESVDAVVNPQPTGTNETAAHSDAEGSVACNAVATMIASRAVRVTAKVRHLHGRVLFCTPQRVGAFNPMWQLFRLAERVPTDEVVMDGVPVFSPATGSALNRRTLVRLVSSGNSVSRIVEVPVEKRVAAMLDDAMGEAVDLGTITLPQDIARYPVDEGVTVVAQDGSLKRLEAGRAVALTLCAVDGSHPGLLWHIDVLGGASGAPKAGSIDQRAHVPAGEFAVVPTKALRTPEEFADFQAAAQASSWRTHSFPLLKVEASQSATLEFNEKEGLAAIERVLETARTHRH